MSSPTFDLVKEIIDIKIKPLVQEHGGGIELKSVQGGTVYIKLLGACRNCPSAQLTVENHIKRILIQYFPSIEKVAVTDNISSDLMDMARKILSHA
ncbi:MAG TPA: NifU family protein [Petrotogaceae bacterium]|nr:NifU family protein [Petrotogaceae bacterium]HQH33619.1 NifU family protein [Petrotogaceae bacterium]